MFSTAATSPDPEALATLRAALADLAPATRARGPWKSGAFRAMTDAGLLAGFIPADCGGSGAREGALLAALTEVARGCLTTALALTQWASACRLLAAADDPLRRLILPRLASGEETTTVGIAQLTTSRQHQGTPALRAARRDGGWRLDGVCPWVTGADTVDTIVTGAVAEDGAASFFVVRRGCPGLAIDPPMELLALSAARTSRVRFDGVEPEVVIRPTGPSNARAGGLATTALALGATRAALDILGREAAARRGMSPIVAGFAAETDALAARMAAGAVESTPADRDALRTAASGLVLRASQAALVASKGAGFTVGHPAERGVREAMLFLVWSCPEQVASAVLCELAQLGDPA
jgi:alkylation response protein AidB-like acyl-CoA dehydrogenase